MPLIPTYHGNSSENAARLTTDVLVADQLVAGGSRAITVQATITGGAPVGRGYVLGKITSTGAYKIAVKTATDGSQVPVAIAADGVDAREADAIGGVYRMGSFDGNFVGYDGSFTLAEVTAALDRVNIYLTTPMPATDAA